MNFLEMQIFSYICGEQHNTKVQNCDTKYTVKGASSRPGQTDELYQTNSVAYIEADLKINHLRILMAIIKHLQTAIRFKVGRTVGKGLIPDSLLPPVSTHTRFYDTRVLEIPVSDFHMGLNNGGRLRSCPIMIPGGP